MTVHLRPPTLGERLEGEWIPGHWHSGSVCDVDAKGRLTIRYDDGYMQAGVELERVRPLSKIAGASGNLEFERSTRSENTDPQPGYVLTSTQDAGKTNATPLDSGSRPPDSTESTPVCLQVDARTISKDFPAAHFEEVDSEAEGSFCAEPVTPNAWAFACSKSSMTTCCGSRRSGELLQDPAQSRGLPGHQKVGAFSDEFAPVSDEGADDRLLKLRARIAEASAAGDAGFLQHVLSAARQGGARGPEVRKLHDMVVEVEAEEFRRRADRLVEEAVASDDWWRLQAAMQIVVSSGLGHEKAAQLTAAMRAQRARLLAQVAKQQEQEDEEARKEWVPWLKESAEALEAESFNLPADADDLLRALVVGRRPHPGAVVLADVTTGGAMTRSALTARPDADSEVATDA
eukprot:CAMPEP_0177181330 /NCGR_PEP_ID=MMETSP0367-20130122/15867_1 /TAXON_ID=447022 ORGANISM="Scrippsiella hangoei-like, Strain SHHI-4" /NCGR_SAMPLE_ID=MMETSP0367 /ASSEMBLY_ACC=CAM_ASM_000362 /LENGTH=402 /DNA_ID=CAMNT_0018628173 /DNA_START=38 /DNA_END=1247 /DNA_ORIENTATION=+